MATVITDGTKLNNGMTATANKIREKTGNSDPIAWDYSGETGFADAIDAIQTGGTPVLVELRATENRVYFPPSGADGFSRVSVDVGERSPRCDQVSTFDWGEAQKHMAWNDGTPEPYADPVNLLPFPANAFYISGESVENDGVTFSVGSDGSVTLNGTREMQDPTAWINTYIAGSANLTPSSARFWMSEGDYVIALNAPSGGLSVTVWAWKKTSGASSLIYQQDASSPIPFYHPGETELLTGEVSIQFGVPGGASYQSFVFHPMLESGGSAHSFVSPTAVPHVLQQPQNVEAAAGATATLSAKSCGRDLSFEWQTRASSSDEWAAVSGSAYAGQTTDTLRIGAASSLTGHQYRCKLSNTGGTVYTNAVELTVLSA